MIKTEQEYDQIVERIEELLKDSANIENQKAAGYIELNYLSDLVVEFEEKHFEFLKPLDEDLPLKD